MAHFSALEEDCEVTQPSRRGADASLVQPQSKGDVKEQGFEFLEMGMPTAERQCWQGREQEAICLDNSEPMTSYGVHEFEATHSMLHRCWLGLSVASSAPQLTQHLVCRFRVLPGPSSLALVLP